MIEYGSVIEQQSITDSTRSVSSTFFFLLTCNEIAKESRQQYIMEYLLICCQLISIAN